MDLFLYTLRSIIALIGVIWLVNFTLKYIDRYANKQAKSIEVIERISVSKSSSLAIVKIIEQYYVMSISESSTEILEKISEEEAKMIDEQVQKNREKSEQMLDQQLLKQLQEKWTTVISKVKEK